MSQVRKVAGAFVAALMGLAISSSARVSAAEIEPADLRLRIPSDAPLRYAWSIETSSDSKGQERGEDLDLIVKKKINLGVVLLRKAEQDPAKKDMTVIMRFEGFETEESRSAGKDTRTLLRVGRNNIFYKENGKILIDSQNDIGLEQISDYQRNLSNLEKGKLEMTLDPTGRLVDSKGNASLVDSLHGGQANSTFPILAGRSVQAQETWDERFEMRNLGEVKLDEPASVLARVRFAGWKIRDGKNRALLEVVSAWETRELKGKDKNGLAVALTEMEGLGTGLCYFDPESGHFVEGEMSYQCAYKIEGVQDGETTHLDVKNKTRFSFKLKPKDVTGPRP